MATAVPFERGNVRRNMHNGRNKRIDERMHVVRLRLVLQDFGASGQGLLAEVEMRNGKQTFALCSNERLWRQWAIWLRTQWLV